MDYLVWFANGDTVETDTPERHTQSTRESINKAIELIDGWAPAFHIHNGEPVVVTTSSNTRLDRAARFYLEHNPEDYEL